MMRKTFLTSALDMPEIMSYIYNKSWKLQFSASSSIIIIEDFYLQTFLHSLGKTNILDILVRCYAFSIPLWITIIVSLKRKEKQYRYFKKRPPPVQRVVCSRAISPCYQARVSRRWLSLQAMEILFTQPSHSSVQAILLLTRRYPLRGFVTTWH